MSCKALLSSTGGVIPSHHHDGYAHYNGILSTPW